MRYFSSILFALMALVLPMAGVQKHFCVVAMAFLDCAGECPADERENCCEDVRCVDMEAPTCLIGAKLLPSADLTVPAHIPALDGVELSKEMFVSEIDADDRFRAVFPMRHRSPPDESRTYVVQRRLLI